MRRAASETQANAVGFKLENIATRVLIKIRELLKYEFKSPYLTFSEIYAII